MSSVTSPPTEGSARASCLLQRWSFLPAELTGTECGLTHLATNIQTVLQLAFALFCFVLSFCTMIYDSCFIVQLADVPTIYFVHCKVGTP